MRNQIILLALVTFADSYSDGIMVRYLIQGLLNSVSWLLKVQGIKSVMRLPKFPYWVPYQWFWHLAKWVSFFSLPIYNIFFVWEWPFWSATVPVALLCVAIWQLTYRLNFLYGKELP